MTAAASARPKTRQELARRRLALLRALAEIIITTRLARLDPELLGEYPS
jgi:hypothetical protein